MDFCQGRYDKQQLTTNFKITNNSIMTMTMQMNSTNADVTKLKIQVAQVLGLSKVALRQHCKDSGLSAEGSLKVMRTNAANKLIDTLPGGCSPPKLCRSIGQDKWSMGTWILKEQIQEAEKAGKAPPTELCVSGLYEPPDFLRWKFVVRKLNGIWLNETYFHLRLSDSWILEKSNVSSKMFSLY